jgi:4-hydroxybenzoate polyprenyltransferase
MTSARPALPSLTDLVRALRPNQWTKNAVVLAAFFFALGDHNQTVTWLALGRAVAAAAVFCILSSAIYLLNDIRDVDADRQHPVKRHRPIAAGRVPVPLAGLMAAVLLVVGGLAALRLTPGFAAVAGGYVLLQVAYTLLLKRVALVDVFIIALGFVLRAAAGGLALRVFISPWLLLCAFLLALFLALCKRRHEKLTLNGAAEAHRASLEHYDRTLLDLLIAIAASATIVCYAIYTLWPDTVQKFGTSRLSLTIPFVIFGVFRYLDIVFRHDSGGRPEKTLLSDIPLLVDLALYGATVFAVFAWAR